jgi:hypothetical protein
MPPIATLTTDATDARIQGLHILAVLAAARTLATTLALNGGAGKACPLIQAELQALVDEIDTLSRFEREAQVRGTIRGTEGAEIAALLDASRNARNLTGVQRAAARMDEDEVGQAFDSEDLFADPAGAPAVATPEPDDTTDPNADPFGVP